jgi:hypothetical protein
VNLKTISTVFLSSAGIVAVTGLAVWLATGAHTGWTQTKIPRTIVDEITEIEAVVFEDGFVAGVDFLGAALALAAVLASIGWIIARRKRS